MSRLAVVYHRPFTRASDGSLWEAEGAFSRYVESLAERFDEVHLCVPVREGPAAGHRLRATNLVLCTLPYFESLDQFYRALPTAFRRAWTDSACWDAVNLRVPTWFAPYAYLIARLRQIPVVLLVVGDLKAAVAASKPLTLKRRLHRLHVVAEEAFLRRMCRDSLTLCNGAELLERYRAAGPRVLKVRTSTLEADSFFVREDTCQTRPVRLLCVSRVDPRKGIRSLPDVIARLRDRGIDVTLRIVGPLVGSPGADEMAASVERARRLGVGEQVTFVGGATIERVFEEYRAADLFVLPTLPGEGVPRVLLESMASSLPVVATRVGGIPGAVHDGETGLLVPPGSSEAVAEAVARIVDNGELRRRLIRNGLREARANTVEALAEFIADRLRDQYGLKARKTSSALERGRRLRISIPLAGFNLSGGVLSLVHLANGLAARGHRVRFVVPDFAARPPIPLVRGVDVRVLRMGPLGRRARQGLYYLRLLVESTQGADVCLANYWPTAFAAIVSRALADPATRLAYNVRAYEPTTHGDLAEAGPLARRIRAALARLSYRLPLHHLVTSEYLRRGIQDSDAEVMGHGIDLDVFRSRNREESGRRVVVGIIGRPGPVKGYTDFLAATSLLCTADRIDLRVVHDDPVPLPTVPHVLMLGARSEQAMADFYRACDVFVFPSRSEGFGLPALEALASGCALVVTDCGGVREFARPDENCLMVPVADPVALAKAIDRLVDDLPLRLALSNAGPATVQLFGREAVVSRFEAALMRLASGQ